MYKRIQEKCGLFSSGVFNAIMPGIMHLARNRGSIKLIASPKLKRNINYLYNFSENMQNIGVTPSSCVLECTVLEHVDDHIKEALKLPDSNTKVFLLKRIRKGNNDPILCESTYIPYYLCPGIESYDFSSHSLYVILSESIYLFLTMPQKY